MALIAAVSAFLGRAAGRILQTTLGWASVLLFGRVPRSREMVLAAITLGSIAWIAALLGVALPGFGVFLLTAIPRVPYVQDWMLRLVMLAAALLIPLLIGAAGLLLVDPARRPRGPRVGMAILRGYPFAFVLAFTLVFLSVVAVARKGRSLARRWQDDHVPIVVKPGAYRAVADDLEDALHRSGLGVSRRRAPRVLEVPSHLLARVAGRGVRALVPDRLVMLEAPGLEVLLYPSDIAISGERRLLAAARAALAERLTSSDAHLTTSSEAQDVEDELQRISRQTTERVRRSGPGARAPEAGARTPARGTAGALPAARSMAAATPAAARRTADPPPEDALRDLDRRLASEDFPQPDWEVLYRMRLQVERDLLASRAAGTAAPGPGPGGGSLVPPPGTGSTAGRGSSRGRMTGLAAAVAIGLTAMDVVLALAERRSRGQTGHRR